MQFLRKILVSKNGVFAEMILALPSILFTSICINIANGIGSTSCDKTTSYLLKYLS